MQLSSRYVIIPQILLAFMQQKILLKVFDLKDAHDLIGTEQKFIKRLRFPKASVQSGNADYNGLFEERGGPQSSCPTWNKEP